MPKPQEFYLTVIDFFGILVPGAVLVFLYGPTAISKFNLPLADEGSVRWTAFLVASYVFGQILLGIGVLLNPVALRMSHKWLRPFYDAALRTKRPSQSEQESHDSVSEVFYHSYAVLRLRNEAALAEVEGNMADYKLFRSLVLVSRLDAILFPWLNVSAWSPSRSVFAILLLALTAYRFCFLLYWTYRSAFGYYVLVGGHQPQLQRSSEDNHA